MSKNINKKRVVAAMYILVIFGLVVVFFDLYQMRNKSHSQQNRFKVTTTLFPIYDFARQIGGNKADVSLILPPGAEPHDFEPRPGDVKIMLESDLLLYTSNEMEPWVEKIKRQNDKIKKTSIVSVDKGIRKISEKDGHDSAGIDPHYWLDPQNALIMVQNITSEMSQIDSPNADYYLANSKKLISKLKKLDQDFSSSLSSCKNRTVYHAGHFAFGYFANRYALQYHTLQGFLPESETKASVMADFINSIKSEGAKSVYFEELVDPKVANIIASETGTKTYELNAVHSVSTNDLQRKQTYEDVMRSNLQNLVDGLQCNK